jgi:hypothetical protein
VCFYTPATVDLIVDLNAVSFDTGITSFPNRRTDTRSGTAGVTIAPPAGAEAPRVATVRAFSAARNRRRPHLSGARGELQPYTDLKAQGGTPLLLCITNTFVVPREGIHVEYPAEH